MSTQYGLTPQGFVQMPLTIIQANLQELAQAIWGSDVDTSNQSKVGQFINLISLQQANLWELAQALYSGNSPDTATGVALDDCCARVHVTRLGATSSMVYMILYGSSATAISQGHLIAQENTNLQLQLVSGITIQLSNTGDITINISDVEDDTNYTATINGTDYTYTSGSGATAASIIAGLLAVLEAADISNINLSSPTTTTLELTTADGQTSFNISLGSGIAITTLGSVGQYSAVIPGAMAFPANSINVIVNAVSGLNSVNNLIPAVIGNNIETDDALRVRRRLAIRALGKGTDDSIAQNLIQNVSGVTSAIVYSNRTDDTDIYGRPPHSFEAVVSGPAVISNPGGIALMIWQCMPSGIQTGSSASGSSNMSTIIEDSTGNHQTINWSTPQNIYIWIQITRTNYTKEKYPVNGDTQMKNAIVAWSLTEFSAGVDVLLQRMLSPIYSIQGISNVTIAIAMTTNPEIAPMNENCIIDISTGLVTADSHGLTTGMPVQFGTTGTLPTGIVAGTTYYIIYNDLNSFYLSSSYNNALAGTKLTISGSQSGTQTAITPYLSTGDTPIAPSQIAIIATNQITVTP